MLSVTKRMDEYLRGLFQRYNSMLLQDARQLDKINGWLGNKMMMKVMGFEWRVNTCLLKNEIKKNVQEITDTLANLRKRFKFYESC